MAIPTKILLTGFEPFGLLKENPSQIVAKALSLQTWDCAEIQCLILPVEYIAAMERIADFYHGDWLPDIILHLGVARGRNILTLERFAVNMMDTVNGDNVGYHPDEMPVVAGAPLAYKTTIPCKRIVQYLTHNGIEAKLSNSAGTYVCNAVLFASLHFLSCGSLISSNPFPENVRCGFIHLPLFEKVDKETQLTTVKAIIQWLVKNQQQEFQDCLSPGNVR